MANNMSVEKALGLAGAKLQKLHGGHPIPRQALVDAVVKLCACGRSSVLPSDFTYNLVNRAEVSCERPIFVQEGRGQYRYVGSNFPYSGDIVWRPLGGKTQVVGRWTKGVQRFHRDPR